MSRPPQAVVPEYACPQLGSSLEGEKGGNQYL